MWVWTNLQTEVFFNFSSPLSFNTLFADIILVINEFTFGWKYCISLPVRCIWILNLLTNITLRAIKYTKSKTHLESVYVYVYGDKSTAIYKMARNTKQSQEFMLTV